MSIPCTGKNCSALNSLHVPMSCMLSNTCPREGMAVQFHMFSAALGGYLSNHDTSCSRLFQAMGALHATFSSLLHSLCTATTADHLTKFLVMGPCRLLGCDVYSFDFKIAHIARHIQLPAPPLLGPGAKCLSDAEQIPPLLVLNIQLPMYPVSLASTACLVPSWTGIPPCTCLCAADVRAVSFK